MFIFFPISFSYHTSCWTIPISSINWLTCNLAVHSFQDTGASCISMTSWQYFLFCSFPYSFFQSIHFFTAPVLLNWGSENPKTPLLGKHWVHLYVKFRDFFPYASLYIYLSTSSFIYLSFYGTNAEALFVIILGWFFSVFLKLFAVGSYPHYPQKPYVVKLRSSPSQTSCEYIEQSRY